MKHKSIGKSLGAKLRKSKSDILENTNTEVSSLAAVESQEQSRGENFSTSRIVKGSAGKITAFFAMKSGGLQEIDISFFSELPQLSEPFSQGFLKWGRGASERTRWETSRNLKRGAIRFLSDYNSSAELLDLDEALLTAFVKWLNSKDSSSLGNVLHPSTRKNMLGCLKKIIDVLRDGPWAREALWVLEHYPIHQFPMSGSKSKPRSRLSREHLEAIYEAAYRDLCDIQQRLQEGASLLEEGKENCESGNVDYGNLATTLYEMSRRYPSCLPNYKQLRIEAPELYNWVYRSNKGNQGFGIVRLGGYLYASPRDLVPLVLLLAIEGGFNPESIMELELKDIEVVVRLGVACLRVSPPKRRAKRNPIKYLDLEWMLPWLQTLEQITWRLRLTAEPEDRERVFIFAQRWGEKRKTTSFFSTDGKTGLGIWHQSLVEFIKQYELENFTLAQIRPTESDELGQSHGSIVASQALNHISFATTEKSYLGDGTRSREGEKLCLVVEEMRRWVESKGVIDTRRSRRTPLMDRGSATPGFHCADPYLSPRSGQMKNRLCAAYGECPSCALGSAQLNDTVCVANYFALEDAILSSRSTIAPQAWISKWAPILADLKALIAQVRPETIASSRQFKVFLPPVG